MIGRDDDGRPDGFLSYVIKDHWEGQRPRNTLEVHDLIGLDAPAGNRLWRYCLEVDWVATVSAGDHWVSDPLRWILGDARAMAEHERTDLLWVRLLDVAAALAGRRYLCPGRVVVEVDDTMGLSGGRFALDGGPDGAQCVPTTDPADLALSVSALSSAYLGGYTLADLARGGRVEERRPGALATADAMFRSPCPPGASRTSDLLGPPVGKPPVAWPSGRQASLRAPSASGCHRSSGSAWRLRS